MSDRLNFHPAHVLHKLLEARKIKSSEICGAVFTQIESSGNKINAYIRTEKENAFKYAEGIDDSLSSAGDGSSLKGNTPSADNFKDFTGIPIAIKDNICTKGIMTTCASKILSNYMPVYDATVIDRLNAQRFILTGKANMDEFAMGSSNENSFFGPVRNPWDTGRVPGGSSGGPAAAVASGRLFVPLVLIPEDPSGSRQLSAE